MDCLLEINFEKNDMSSQVRVGLSIHLPPPPPSPYLSLSLSLSIYIRIYYAGFYKRIFVRGGGGKWSYENGEQEKLLHFIIHIIKVCRKVIELTTSTTKSMLLIKKHFFVSNSCLREIFYIYIYIYIYMYVCITKYFPRKHSLEL